MSDYLTNLVATNLRLAPVLEPRVAALFEPGSPDAPNADALEIESPREIPEPGSEPSLQVMPLKPRVVIQRDLERDGVPAPARRERAKLFAPPAVQAAPHPVESFPRAEPPRVASVSSAVPQAVQPEQRVQSSSLPLIPQPRNAIVVQPQVKPYTEPAAPEHAAQENHPLRTSPVIRVTIGRIDVRAVRAVSPAPTLRKTDAPQRISLNEYLKSRGRGAR